MKSGPLAAWVADARQRSFELLADLTADQLMGPKLEIVNPLLWEIGHHAWFQSFWALRHAAGEDPVLADEDALYDSIAIAHDTRWNLPLPSRDDTLQYACEVRDRVLRLLDNGDPASDLAYHILYSVLHEDMHTEAITYVRQTLEYRVPALDIPKAAAGTLDAGPLPGDAEIPGGTFSLGSRPSDGFAFDNEKWAHPVSIEPFSIARAPATQSQFADFVDAGGYRASEFWCDEGWRWREQTGAIHPVYWRQSGGNWQRRDFTSWLDLEPHRPVVNVNWYESQAYCRWAHRRLPSEAEWEVAAAAEPVATGFSETKRKYPWGDQSPTAARANLDWLGRGCADVGAFADGDSAFGCRQMLGNVWEWTSSVFRPFPGFVADAYKEYSEPWFESRKVLRGGAWATRSRLARTNYRNYFTPDRRDVWAGFRTCATA